jgi:hypothetical protein
VTDGEKMVWAAAFAAEAAKHQTSTGGASQLCVAAGDWAVAMLRSAASHDIDANAMVTE